MTGEECFNNLSDELKAKAQACETVEEVLALVKEEGYVLNDKELEAISGGWGSTHAAKDKSNCKNWFCAGVQNKR